MNTMCDNTKCLKNRDRKCTLSDLLIVKNHYVCYENPLTLTRDVAWFNNLKRQLLDAYGLSLTPEIADLIDFISENA